VLGGNEKAVLLGKSKEWWIIREDAGNVPGMLGRNEKSQASLNTLLFCFVRNGQVNALPIGSMLTCRPNGTKIVKGRRKT